MVTSMITCSSIADCLPVHNNRVSYGIAFIKLFFFGCNDWYCCVFTWKIYWKKCTCVQKQVSDFCLRGRRAQHSSRNSAGQGPRWRRDHIQNYSRQWGGQLCHRQPERWDDMFQICFFTLLISLTANSRFLNIH